jgi:hypothetical protein
MAELRDRAAGPDGCAATEEARTILVLLRICTLLARLFALYLRWKAGDLRAPNPAQPHRARQGHAARTPSVAPLRRTQASTRPSRAALSAQSRHTASPRPHQMPQHTHTPARPFVARAPASCASPRTTHAPSAPWHAPPGRVSPLTRLPSTTPILLHYQVIP